MEMVGDGGRGKRDGGEMMRRRGKGKAREERWMGVGMWSVVMNIVALVAQSMRYLHGVRSTSAGPEINDLGKLGADELIIQSSDSPKLLTS